ncbi:DUF3349 domain-containing protein [Gordonia sp. NB41Y]|uniref:DUF3349 domain-containing protein n=1 Tax=Gordonia sp. NB41Y TaxID=875808 RepID=UPI0002BD6100|nr:DUF3349 domain-containing protein [Gordonia sp. NB41Y]EMP14570.1 hypothetical protein ISGA_2202 [Gordonia sp. NB41Y]WLP92106.1 DUF3349 domain-containing protein [Gordonia sp. NB41Y]
MSNPSLFESAVGWIRKGYPEGIPSTDFPPLLALLIRSELDETEVTQVALRLARDNDVNVPVPEEAIRDAIAHVTSELPTDDEINQVAGRLASAGWPLATTAV